jgi:sulfide:quinone oxidoreductase
MAHPASSTASAPGVLIAGGGVAALEALMALRELAGDRVDVTLVAPEPDFVHRPMATAEPFELGAARHYPLQRIARDFGAGLVRAAVRAIDAPGHRVELRGGDELGYETLILAPGARALPAFDDALTFAGPASAPAMRSLLGELEDGAARRIAFVVPTLAGWSLPLYELALMTARHAAARSRAVDLSLVTPEPRPLAVFGERPSAVVAQMLVAAGVEFAGGVYADPAPGGLRLTPGGRLVEADRIVALPLIRGPQLGGVPAEPELGFIPVDGHGRVEGLADVYAAGDATAFAVKQGGLAAQQADAVAEHVAARHGAPVDPAPFRPVLRGMLFTGGAERFMRAVPGAPGREGESAAHALWWPPTKIAGRRLAPYLFAREPGAAPPDAPAGFEDLEVPLSERLPTPAGG